MFLPSARTGFDAQVYYLSSESFILVSPPAAIGPSPLFYLIQFYWHFLLNKIRYSWTCVYVDFCVRTAQHILCDIYLRLGLSILVLTAVGLGETNSYIVSFKYYIYIAHHLLIIESGSNWITYLDLILMSMRLISDCRCCIITVYIKPSNATCCVCKKTNETKNPNLLLKIIRHFIPCTVF